MRKQSAGCGFRQAATLALSIVTAAMAATAGERTMTEPVWDEQVESLFTGPVAGTVADLAPYQGAAAAERIATPARREAYQLNARQLRINYGPGVEAKLRDELVILCPQTALVLYDGFTPPECRYIRGSRPLLEQAVAGATSACRTDEDRALAIMRFCRDLRLRDPDADFASYVYGGTEEQLIAKPDILCETLSRLMVALCEVTGIRGRLVMHILGGHITTEILIDGRWAYIDPRCGIYFRTDAGQLASVLDLCREPSIIRRQSAQVKADASAQWTWAFRAWKCENMYFSPNEVNGFENYSLADAARYDYTPVSRRKALADGLMDVNRAYVSALRRALGLASQGWHHQWQRAPLSPMDIAYRHDGFSIFYKKPPMDRAEYFRRYVDPFANSNVGTLVWGVGPGSVFCYETKVGQIFGEGLTGAQRALLREGDLWVHENVMGLVAAGGPMALAVEGAHGIGKKLIARLEMNHEYGPAKEDNWKWVAFVGRLNKEHPEYRIGRGVLLDYKHREVRDFKLAILRETVQLGADGVSLDFAVYPPFFANPEPGTMTAFVRAVRAMLDKEAEKQGRRLELMVRVPATGALALGLDWETWMDEQLIDRIFPTHRRFSDHFDIRVEHVIDKGVETGIPVYPTVWQALGFVDTDQRPGDKAAGRRRYDKPKTPGMYRAQALLFMRAGAAGIQLGMSEDQWRGKPWMDDLGDPRKLLFADKHYMVDPIALRPGTFELSASAAGSSGHRRVGLRVADDVAAAATAGLDTRAEMVVYCRPLEEGEVLEILVNGKGSVTIDGASGSERDRRSLATFDPSKQKHERFMFERNWWKRGEHKLTVPASWWQLGDNEIELRYDSANAKPGVPLSITWVDLILSYTGH
ncbi:MAG: hypothetical protein HN742_24010 [Lentisphaerae bacterium]|jgi:hypothetical protein|nr:hypothetical protein [Lentisphaerota bacterium]MBT5611536.1 hypothetical protein [Lentisphaerota bacterium]MBT7059563.1 hypothetical protein [Lentisphaerota bacterium]MBT7844963.1 hypothetical protein [Lentisphaerota bacterium]